MKAQQLKNAILQLAIQGKLVPQDPNDEPASVLFEKIQAEKEKLIAEGKIKKTKKTSDKRPLDVEVDFPFEIPDSWEWVRLGELFEITSSKRVLQSQWKTSGIPFYRAREIVSLKKGQELKDPIFIDINTYNESISISGKPEIGDLLVTGVGTFGQYLVVKDDTPFYFKDGNVVWFKNNSKIYIEYICKYMDSKFFIDSIYSSSQGTTVGTFTIINAKTMLVPFPPLNEQKRIVAKIEELLPFIEEYDKKEQKLTTLNQQFPDQLKKSILQAAIQGQLVAQEPNDEPASELIKRIQAEKERLISEKKIKKPKVKSEIVLRNGLPYEIINGVERCIADELPFEIPESWCWVRLSEICSNIHYGYTASASSKGTHKLLRITDIQNNKVSWNDVPFCSLSEKEAENYTLKKGNIVIARTGGTIGKSFLINNIQEQSVFASYLIRIVLLSHVYEKYISYYLNSPFYWEQLRSYSMGTGQPNVNSVSLGCLFISLPPLSEQKRIVQKIEEVFSHIESL